MDMPSPYSSNVRSTESTVLRLSYLKCIIGVKWRVPVSAIRIGWLVGQLAAIGCERLNASGPGLLRGQL